MKRLSKIIFFSFFLIKSHNIPLSECCMKQHVFCSVTRLPLTQPFSFHFPSQYSISFPKLLTSHKGWCICNRGFHSFSRPRREALLSDCCKLQPKSLSFHFQKRHWGKWDASSPTIFRAALHRVTSGENHGSW